VRKEDPVVHRYELQLWEPDKGGWRTVLTAASAESMKRSARTLQWQTRKPVRVVGPEGVVPLGAEDNVEPSIVG
jgi:hypothetical protein